MKNNCNPSKLIAAIAQLLLLGACGSPVATQSNLPAPLNDRTGLRDTDKTQKELSDKVAKQESITFTLRQDFDALKQDIDTFKIVFALAFLVLLPAVGLASYFFARKPRSSVENTRSRKRLKELDASSASVSQEPNQNKSGGLGLGSANRSVHSSQSSDSPPDGTQSTSQSSQYQKPDIQAIKDKYSNSPITNTSRNIAIPQQSQTNQSLTYDLSIECYQTGKYDLLQPYSQGYFSATPESMTRNRAYQENPLELVQSYDGLFWIIKTVDSHCLLFPNPEKRIEQTRILGIEYFFGTNFKNENYQSVTVTDPAYMGYENGKWVMRQKGQIDFGY